MRRSTLRRGVVLTSVLALGAFVTALVLRRPTRVRHAGSPPHAAGGVAHVEDGNDDAADALIEDARRYDVRSWSFDLDQYELRIEDAGMTTALDTVLTRSGAELVVNGGFFDPDGRPVGLAVSRGAVLSRLAKSLSGGVLTADQTRADLFAVEGFALADGTPFAIQCRPRLVVGGAPNVKSDDGQRAERSALCVRDEGRRVDVIVVRGSEDGESVGPSLFALARYLGGGRCDAALNLDGGPSTGVAWREAGDVKLLAPRRPVRHVVAFAPRGAR